MINVNVGSKEIRLKWYEGTELKEKTVRKSMIYCSRNAKEGKLVRDIYTKRRYRTVTGRAIYKLPEMPIPYPVYDWYDYGAAAKLLYFNDIKPTTPRAVFFDIETTSLEPKDGVVTSICWKDSFTGLEFYALNRGEEGNEKECLQAFVDYLNDHNILSLIGFNSNGFDIPYIEARCLVNGVRFRPKEYLLEDVMLIANKLFISGSLNVIAKQLKVETKLEVDNPVKLWNEKRFDELLEYNTQDVVVTEAVYEKLDMKNFMEALFNLTWFDYSRVGANSNILNMFYNKRMWEDNLCVSKASTDYLGDFGGGYNFNNTGVYHNIYVYDFSSLYPNLMRGAKLSPENYGEDDFNYSHVKDQNLVIRPECFKDVTTGVLDTYITELLDLRKQYKAEGKNNEQLACKILANSVYGILSQKTAKFFMGGSHLSATVTWLGRNMLKGVSHKLEKQDIKTVYGKTDSIFIDSPLDIAHTSEIVQKCVDETWFKITGTKNETLAMDFEGLYEKLWIINKNNYCYIKDGEIRTKGGSFKTTKSSDYEKDVTNTILDLVMNQGFEYKADVKAKLKEFTTLAIATKPISYFAIKHKARRERIDFRDDGELYMLNNGLGEPDYGFYHNVCKVVSLPPQPPYQIIMFPLSHEPKGGYMVDRRWISGQCGKIVNKLRLKDKKKQMNLDCFMAA